MSTRYSKTFLSNLPILMFPLLDEEWPTFAAKGANSSLRWGLRWAARGRRSRRKRRRLLAMAETESKHMLRVRYVRSMARCSPAAFWHRLHIYASLFVRFQFLFAWRGMAWCDSSRLKSPHSAQFDSARRRRQVINRNQLNISYGRTRDDDGESGLWLTFLRLSVLLLLLRLLFFLFLSFSLKLWCYYCLPSLFAGYCSATVPTNCSNLFPLFSFGFPPSIAKLIFILLA